MSNEVATIDPTSGEVAERFTPRNELEEWAMDMGTAYQIASKLVTTSFVPNTYKGRPDEAAAAIMTGQELGLDVLASLRSIDIIQGTPALRAVTLRALVQAAGHQIWVEESTRSRAIVRGRRKGSDNVETSEWTIDRARELQLTSKDNWKKQPTAMLLARATSELARLIAADVILAIPYTTEELQDKDPEKVEEAPRKAPAKRTMKRKSPEPVEQKKPEEPAEPQMSEESEELPIEEAKPAPEEPVSEVPDGDPLKPTPEELAEWGQLPEGMR